MPNVSVFIPHHHNVKLLDPLFTSLRDMDMDPDEVEYVLVDNGSTDGSTDWVRTHFPEIKILSLGRNEGFAPALNRAAKTFETEWLCFLNNDVRVDVDWLSNLVHASNRTDGVCFASHILTWNGKQTQFGGGWINLFGKGFELAEVETMQSYDIFFPCGNGMLVRRDIFLEAGGFDPDYFMIYEDVDFGWRLHLLGHSVYMVSDARIMHRGHTSLEHVSYREKANYYERNSLATIFKNLSDASLHAVLPLALQETALRAKAIGGMGIPVRYSEDGFAILQALDSFFKDLPKWKEKRRWIQSQRRVDDAQILKTFFPHPTQVWAYNDTHYKRIQHPDIFPRIEKLYLKAAEALGMGS